MSAEGALNALEDLLVIISGNKGNSLSLGFESACSSDSVHVVFSSNWHIEVDDEVHLFDINASSEQISGDQDSILAFLEFSVDTGTFFLFKVSEDECVRVALLSEELREILSTILLVDENNQLIEVDLSQQLQENRDLLLLFDLEVVLVETVQNQL